MPSQNQIKVLFHAPHESEHPIAAPSQRALLAVFRSRNLKSDEKLTTGLNAKIIGARAMLEREKGVFPFDDEHNLAFNKVCALLDVEARIDAAHSLFSANPNSFLVEVHGSPENPFSSSSSFHVPEGWAQIPGTLILCTSLYRENIPQIPDSWPFLQAAEKIARFFGFAPAELARKAENLMKKRQEINLFLEQHAKILEFTGENVPIPQKHPAYGFYYDGEGNPRCLESNYEHSYCASFVRPFLGADSVPSVFITQTADFLINLFETV